MSLLRPAAFLLFVVSGCCGLIYQIVWLRLAFASFGIVTPVLSILLSAFMAGLALGSWLGGLAGRKLSARSGSAAALAYGLVECGIAGGALVVPWAFDAAERLLLDLGESSSASYLAWSALGIALPILLFATLMGTTFPLMMAFLRRSLPGDEGTFSFLYLANVIGAMLGACLTAAVLVESLGFRATLLVAAAGNVAIGIVALLLPRLSANAGTATPSVTAPRAIAAALPLPTTSAAMRRCLLFTTGFTSMAMEVAWTRAFTPVLATTVYAFAAVLAVYLFATWLGSACYRRHLRTGRTASAATLLALLFPASLLPLVLNDPRWHHEVWIVLASIVPISALLGYLTPQLVDEHGRGEPAGAGRAYAINVLGCIAGPLVAGYALLPTFGVKGTLIGCALAYPAFLLFARGTRSTPWRVGVGTGVAALVTAFTSTRTHEDADVYLNAEVRRDHVATVVSHTLDETRRLEKDRKRMLVNGIGITTLTDLTKVMAHLPLALRARPPESTLVICFGMGTTFRSLTTWGGRTTAVELVPSVADAFGYYWADAAEVLARPGARVVIDDGRRFLNRTQERFDLITIDPPPPVEAGGSSLLYTSEFYATLRARLSPTGLLQQWFPGGEDAIMRAVLNTVVQAFPHVLVFRAYKADSAIPPHVAGIHILAADWPLEAPTIAQAVARTPEAAKQDLLEWHPGLPLEMVWERVLKQRIDVRELLPENPRLGVTDDRPFNEYFFLRRTFGSSARLESTLPR